MKRIMPEEYRKIASREYFVFDNEKKYPNDMSNEQLDLAYSLLLESFEDFKLHLVMQDCSRVYKIPNLPGKIFEANYGRQLRHFNDYNITKKKWLLLESPLYNLILDEAKHRKHKLCIIAASQTNFRTTQIDHYNSNYDRCIARKRYYKSYDSEETVLPDGGNINSPRVRFIPSIRTQLNVSSSSSIGAISSEEIWA